MAAAPLLLLQEWFSRGECQRLVLSQPVTREVPYQKVVVQPVLVRQQSLWQIALHTATQVTHENLSTTETLERLALWMAGTFRQVMVRTAQQEYMLHQRARGEWKVKARGLVKQETPEREIVPKLLTTAGHNRTKAYLIPENVPCPFLQAAGVMTPEGKVRAPLYHKFRQINRYLELVRDVSGALPDEGCLQVVDFGCGKSYLTFALHYLLTEILRREVRIVGLDRRADMVRDCAAMASTLHCAGLEFREGDLAEYEPPGKVDLAVSLHACDTATDAALARAVVWNCQVILAVPCCQHELAEQLAADSLVPLLRHGLLRERFAALATDALRAQLLEICGYATQVVEFIELEHTPKNILLRAVRRSQRDPHLAQRIAEYHRMKIGLGIRTFTLEHALREVLPGEFATALEPAY